MGRSHKTRECPRCGSRDVQLQDTYDDGWSLYICSDCDHDFEVGGSRQKNRGRHNDGDDVFEDIPPEYEEET